MKPSYEELEQMLEESQREFRSADITMQNLEAKLKAADINETDARCHAAELEARCSALAAESSSKSRCLGFFASVIKSGEGWTSVCEREYSEAMETPAIDAFLAEARAQGVEMLTASRKSEWMDTYIDDANEFAAPPSPGVADFDIHRDANRYRFLRDKDSFGDEGAPGLASWDDLAELDMGDFDSAVDARLLSCEFPQHILTEAHDRTATAGVYAELYRLREEIKGPNGFDTWKDAAIAERKIRVELEKSSPCLGDIDYLGAMAAYHSDEWHKIGPITGYMRGWNAFRAAMLQGKVDGNSPVIPDGYSLVPVPDEFLGSGQNERGMFELSEDCMCRLAVALSQQSKGMVTPPGYVMVPVEPTIEMLNEFDSIIDYGAEDSKDAWNRLIAAAPQQESIGG